MRAPDLAGYRIRKSGRDQCLEEDGSGMCFADDLDNVRELLRSGLRLGREPSDGDLVEPVAGREVPERRVARHDLMPLACAQAGAIRAVEPVQVGDQAD